MQVKISRDSLLKGLGYIERAVSTRTLMPILTNFLMEAETSGKIRLIGTDMDISVSTVIEGTTIEPGSTTIPAKKFIALVKESKVDELTIKTDEKFKIDIKAGKSKFTLSGLPINEFPTRAEIPKSQEIVLKSSVLSDMMNKTIYAHATESNRGLYKSLSISSDETGKHITISTTDTVRMAYITSEQESKIDINILIPIENAKKILSILSELPETNVSIYSNKNCVCFKTSIVVMFSRLIDGKFPNLKNIFPKQFSNSILLKTPDFINALRQIKTVIYENAEGIGRMCLKLDKNSMILSTEDSESSAEVHVDVTYTGRPISVYFNPNYILDAVENFSDTCKFDLNDETKASVLSDTKREGYLNLIMPMISKK